MRAATAYFAGAGTVIAAIVGGVGGGLLIADMISPKSPRQGTEMTRLERRMSPEPIPATATAALEPVPYLSAPQPSAPGAAVATASVQALAQTDAANSEPTRAKPADTSTAAQPAAPAAQAAQPAARDQAGAADDALARARDADVRRAMEKRKAERRQQWTERRRQRQQQELIVVEEKVRQEIEPRREFVSEPVKIEMPQIRLFGPE
jgi:hypothetical protein